MRFQNAYLILKMMYVDVLDLIKMVKWSDIGLLVPAQL